MSPEEADPIIDEFTKWFMFQAFQIKEVPELQNQLAEKLNQLGFGLIRCHIVLNTLHPQVGSEVHRWYKKGIFIGAGVASEIKYINEKEYINGKVETIKFSHKVRQYEVFKNSPLLPVMERGEIIRHKFREEDTEFPYPILKELAELKATDYIVFPLNYSFYSNKGSITWVTDRDGGFSSGELKVLEKLMEMLAVYFRSYLEMQVTSTLLSTYLGNRTGEKVLSGQIKRGDIEKIKAAVWFSDLRNFSAISNQYETSLMIEWLNEYFDLIAASINDNNGEILKYIGDAVLAIFPVTEEGSEQRVCMDALRAARNANKELDIFNRKREKDNLPLLKHGIGLHFGMLEYGNIGSSERLDFTVMGPTVNMASRIEGLCSGLGRVSLASEPFASLCSNIEYLGEYQLKGFEHKEKIYSI